VGGTNPLRQGPFPSVPPTVAEVTLGSRSVPQAWCKQREPDYPSTRAPFDRLKFLDVAPDLRTPWLQQRVLRPLTLRQKRQRLFRDVGLEIRTLLMCLQSRFIAEQFIEQKLCGVFLAPADQE
jgi:hypothetical protein